ARLGAAGRRAGAASARSQRPRGSPLPAPSGLTPLYSGLGVLGGLGERNLFLRSSPQTPSTLWSSVHHVAAEGNQRKGISLAKIAKMAKEEREIQDSDGKEVRRRRGRGR